MEKTLPQRTALVIVGPTGVGKTAVTVEIARRLPVEVVSADARQFYKYMDIGTAKPAPEILREIPHHFVGFLDPAREYSAGQFAEDARQVIEEIFARGNIPLVVGGSGLYIRALLEGFFGTDFKDPQLRKKLEQRAKVEGNLSLFEELQKIDPVSAAKIHPQNTKRVIRALEVYYLSSTPLSEWQRKNKNPASFSYKKFGLRLPREILYSRINARVEEMFEQGLIEEVKNLVKKGYSADLNALNTIGYKEVIRFLQGELDLATCKELVKRNTRRYAKRQMTWFRKEKDIIWIELSPEDRSTTIAKRIIENFIGSLK